jgi:AP-1-like transcription factor
LKQSCDTVVAENERLKLNLQKVAIENEILRATSLAQTNRSSPSQSLPDTGPMRYNPTDFYNEVLDGHPNKAASHRITTDPDTGGRLLAVGATWDFIIQHPLFKKGLVDVAGVSEKLKTQAKCDGQGPVFEERAILDAIEKCVASGSDELM